MCIFHYIVVCEGCVQIGMTPLQCAARCGHTCAVEALMSAGADVNAIDGVS